MLSIYGPPPQPTPWPCCTQATHKTNSLEEKISFLFVIRYQDKKYVYIWLQVRGMGLVSVVANEREREWVICDTRTNTAHTFMADSWHRVARLCQSESYGIMSRSQWVNNATKKFNFASYSFQYISFFMQQCLFVSASLIHWANTGGGSSNTLCSMMMRHEVTQSNVSTFFLSSSSSFSSCWRKMKRS